MAIVDLIEDEYVERPAELEEVGIFAAAHLAAGLCRYGEPGTCTLPATHVAVGRADSGPHAGHVARIECCLAHANYYALGWLGPYLIYPAMRGAVWIERR